MGHNLRAMQVVDADGNVLNFIVVDLTVDVPPHGCVFRDPPPPEPDAEADADEGAP